LLQVPYAADEYVRSPGRRYRRGTQGYTVQRALSVGMAVHPRAWDVTFPDAFMTKCTSCKRCTEECPFGAIDEDEKGTPFYKIGRCRRCGTCMGACPERIVSFKDFHVDMIGSMLKGVSVPDDEDQPRIIVLCCENDAYPAIDTVALQHMKIDPAVRFIQLRCLGSVNLVWIADAFSRGIDGIMMLGCKYGDNYQCHMVKGSELANYRLRRSRDTRQAAARSRKGRVGTDCYRRLRQFTENYY